MLLTVDIGNTEITLGLFRGDRITAHWRLTTVTKRTPDEWTVTLTSYLTQAGHSTHEVRGIVYASVAPTVSGPLAEGVQKAVGTSSLAIGPESALPITLDVEDPMSVGADRVVNTLAAAELYGRDTIVVDFGTATTFDCITGSGKFLGGVIAPGIQTAAEYLTRKTAKLPATELVPPEHVIGKRTEDCIRSGVLYGSADAADGIVRRIKAEWSGDGVPMVVATGGLAAHVAPLSQEVEKVEPHLTLLGLMFAARHLGVQW
jgi:type III pantothenate kinase